MTRYMLDTNTVSHLIKGHPSVTRRVAVMPMEHLCVSSITEGELLFGVAKRPEAMRLGEIVREFLQRVDSLPWDSRVAAHYGSLRSGWAGKGKNLAPLDLLIATHAIAVGTILVTNDQAFGHITGLQLEDWTQSQKPRQHRGPGLASR